MKWSLLVLMFSILFPCISRSQEIKFPIKNFAKIDSGILLGKDSLKIRSGKDGIIGPSVVTAAKKMTGDAGSKLRSELLTFKNNQVSASLELQNAAIYHPLKLPFAINSGRQMANVLSLRGTIYAWGLPVNINYSTDQASSAASSYGLNNLFKFNFDPSEFNSLLQSEMFRYTDLRKNILGGKDLTGFVQSAVKDKLLDANALKNSPQQVALSKYLDNPVVTSALLGLNKDQIREKLLRELNDNKASLADSLIVLKRLTEDKLKMPGLPENIKLNAQAVNYLSKNLALTSFMNDAGRFAELKTLNQEQIAAKILELDTLSLPVVHDTSFARARNAVVSKTARDIFISLRQNNTSGLKESLDSQKKSILTEMAPYAGRVKQFIAKPGISPAQADSVAGTISNIREELEKNGLDVHRMMLLEQQLNSNGGNALMTELGSNYLAEKPSNAVQKVLSGVQALKAGSFGNQVPGGIQSRDVFMNGGHLTYRSGGIPLTVGYGSVSDISSFKDAGYQNSIYNQTRNMTYLSAEIPNARGGNLKFSVISSYSKELHSSMYAVPSISANNVALTLSKDMKLGAAGNINLDISKTATLYNNQNLPGGEAIIDRKAGLTNSLTNDLFSAMSVGFRHQLFLPGIDASDNIYFNYAGMGYQNPANNGFGGARMKFGGNLKKSFYNKRLTIAFRTDVTNMPISYTSDDKWKSRQIQFDSRFQVSKKFYLGFKYANGATDKTIDKLTNPVYGFNKIQIDGNASYKLGKYFSVTHFSIGKQDFSNTNITAGAGNLLMVNYTQTLLLKKNIIIATLFYNKELTAYHLIGNMLNSDISCQYMLFSKLNMSTGITYLDNSGTVRQAGIRQGIQLFSIGNFDLDSYADLRRNLVRSAYPDLYPNCRAELSLRYHFKI